MCFCHSKSELRPSVESEGIFSFLNPGSEITFGPQYTCKGVNHPKITCHICAGMHSNGFSGAYCITSLVMRAGASEVPKAFGTDNEKECRLRTNAGFLDGESRLNA